MDDGMIFIGEEVKNYPSLYAALTANQEAVEVLKKEDELIDAQIIETEKKIAIAESVNLVSKGLKQFLTTLKMKKEDRAKQIKAYSSGYLEIPTLQRFPDHVEFKSARSYGFALGKNTPLRVFEAVQKAKEMKLFDRLVVFRNGPDPIVAGGIGDRYFYLASWR